ncbi:hypothetical protein NRB20_14950 [Nocardia sp. RB20]|uniref:Uncharacterized protein n=1 Tax=Nocardia macrotermitis TaxID=2585198 RepID=A0A7K0CY39_9NOCA|nr:hypothetical protein [Nocardia macrotermitis]
MSVPHDLSACAAGNIVTPGALAEGPGGASAGRHRGLRLEVPR